MEFEAALGEDRLDIILADYRLPAYDGLSALRLAKKQRPEVPFIFVSGTMGEDAAIEALTRGATDYVLKDKLSRLVPAVRRALQESRDRRERKRAEMALAQSEVKMRYILDFARRDDLVPLVEDRLADRGRLRLQVMLVPHTPTPDLPVGADAQGRRVKLAQPAQRIISLAPHATEMLFAAGAGERREIQRILHEIAALFTEARSDLARAVEILGELDAVQARVLFGRAIEGRVMIPGEGGDIALRAARHPLLDQRLHPLRREVFGDAERRDPEHRVVPLDFRMPEGVRTLVVSGPNAGGKTVALKTLGLLLMMAKSGLAIPAKPDSVIL